MVVVVVVVPSPPVVEAQRGIILELHTDNVIEIQDNFERVADLEIGEDHPSNSRVSISIFDFA